jgi:hypothetical protein
VNRFAITDVSKSGGGVTDSDQLTAGTVAARSSRPSRPGQPRRVSRTLAAGLVMACAVPLAAGCASANPAKPAAAPSAAAPSAAAPSAALQSAAPPAGNPVTAAERRMLATRYLAVALPANHLLDHDFDGQKDSEGEGDLAAAEADLRAACGTERLFDRQVLAVAFPPQTEPIVRLLYRVNQARAALTMTAAAATSMRQLRGYQQRLDAANGPVEQAVQVIRSQLGLPPPDTS